MAERALEAARAGGRHAAWLKRYERLPSHLIEKAVRSLDKQIERHRQWVANRHTKLPRSYPAEGVRAIEEMAHGYREAARAATGYPDGAIAGESES